MKGTLTEFPEFNFSVCKLVPVFLDFLKLASLKLYSYCSNYSENFHEESKVISLVFYTNFPKCCTIFEAVSDQLLLIQHYWHFSSFIFIFWI